MFRAIVYLFAILNSINVFSSTVLEPANLIKARSNFQLAWGEYAGQDMWEYAVNGDVKFHVVEELTAMVDNIIATAVEMDTLLEHVDPEVIWFCEKDLITQNLLIVTK